MATDVRSREVQRAICVLAAISLVRCGVVLGSEVHLIPEGHTGPVVVLFDDPLGDEVRLDEEGAFVYQIRADGVLRVKNSPPRAGFYRKHFYFEAPDGTRTEIPHRVDEPVVQVFADVQGVTEVLDGQPTGSRRWAAYVVGLPTARADWAQLRDQAAERVIRGVREREP